VNDLRWALTLERTGQGRAPIAAAYEAGDHHEGEPGSTIRAGGRRDRDPAGRAAKASIRPGCGDAYRAGCCTRARSAALGDRGGSEPARACQVEVEGTQNTPHRAARRCASVSANSACASDGRRAIRGRGGAIFLAIAAPRDHASGDALHPPAGLDLRRADPRPGLAILGGRSCLVAAELPSATSAALAILIPRL